MKKTTLLLAIVTTYGVLCCGCATGPRYTYTQQKDSAIVEGPVVPIQGPENGSCNVVITKIDGLADSFTASGKGLNWPVFEFVKPLYLAPGKHALVLSISEIDETYGNVGHGQVGETGAYTASTTATINVDFTANHVYRIGADREGGAMEITLWDETSGPKTRSLIATWGVECNGGYSESALPSHGRR